MTDKSYSIIFSSPTGNTRLLADAIRDALPEENCNYFGVSENADTQSDILFIGFWTDKGIADKATLDLLEKLKNKRIFLFGTAGFGGDEEYFKEILANTKRALAAATSQSVSICVREKCRKRSGSAISNEKHAESRAESRYAD